MPFDYDFSFEIPMTLSPDEIKSIFGNIPFTEPNCSAEEEEEAEEEAPEDFHPMDVLWKSCVYELPLIRQVIFSGPATTILWADDDKTTVKVAEGQQFDRYAGFCAAIVKKMFGSSSKAKNIMDMADADLQRASRAAKAEEEKKKRKDEEIAARAKKAKAAVPSFSDFQKMAYNRAVEMVVDDMAAEMVKGIRERMKLRETTDDIMEAFRKDDPVNEEED